MKRLSQSATTIAALLSTWVVTTISSACSATVGERNAASPPSIPLPQAKAPSDLDRCEAGSLPRTTQESFEAGTAALVSASRQSGVAVVWDGKHAKLVEACHLPSKFTPLTGKDGSGVFHAVDRIFFLPEEIPVMCQSATHLIGAFATGGRAPHEGANGASDRMTAILVPLPCPSVSHPARASGCVGKGMTGPERLARASNLAQALPSKATGIYNAGASLEILALAPDSAVGILEAQPRYMGTLLRQARWLQEQYEIVWPPGSKTATAHLKTPPQRTTPPSLASTGEALLQAPLFYACFPDQVEPQFRLWIDR